MRREGRRGMRYLFFVRLKAPVLKRKKRQPAKRKVESAAVTHRRAKKKRAIRVLAQLVQALAYEHRQQKINPLREAEKKNLPGK